MVKHDSSDDATTLSGIPSIADDNNVVSKYHQEAL
jgi:hypothetical protein